MELIEKLSEKLGLSTQEIAERLNLPEDFKRLDVLNSLGIYGIFETKEDLTQYINKKISNKLEENTRTQQELEEATGKIRELTEELTTNKTKLMDVVGQEFNKINFLNNPSVDLLDLNELDFKNLNKSILKQAEKNKWKVSEPQEEKKESKKEYTFFPKGVVSTF